MIRVTLTQPLADIPPQAISVNEVSGQQAIYFADSDEAAALALGGEVFCARDRDPEPTPLPPPVPPTPRPGIAANGALRRAMIRQAIDLDSVTASIEQIADTQERAETLAVWEYEPYLRRDWSLWVTICADLGLFDEQIDQAFREAAELA
jgi:hypothetical protein